MSVFAHSCPASCKGWIKSHPLQAEKAEKHTTTHLLPMLAETSPPARCRRCVLLSDSAGGDVLWRMLDMHPAQEAGTMRFEAKFTKKTT